MKRNTIRTIEDSAKAATTAVIVYVAAELQAGRHPSWTTVLGVFLAALMIRTPWKATDIRIEERNNGDRSIRGLVLVALLTASMIPVAAHADTASYFSPYDNLQTTWLKEIHDSTNNIRISCYGMTNEPIANALIAAHRRGVIVQVCVDRIQSSSHYDLTRKLSAAGIDVTRKPTTVMEHNKFGIFDSARIITGSWNLSQNAQRQDNSLTVIWSDSRAAQEYIQAWTRIKARDTAPTARLPADPNNPTLHPRTPDASSKLPSKPVAIPRMGKPGFVVIRIS